MKQIKMEQKDSDVMKEEFDELAALYILELLDAHERRIVEQTVLEFPELETTLIELRNAVGAIAYSTPTVPLASNLKERLFQQIANESDATVTALTKQATEVEWESYLIPGLMVGTLHLDVDKREITCFMRVNAGVRFPYHIHAGVEELIVLEGDLVINDKIYGSGDVIYSQAGSAHQPETNNGCLLFIRTSLDDQILI